MKILAIRERCRKAAYTFAEVLVAAAIIGLAIGAACQLVATMMIHEEASFHTAVALNLQENASALWQLGLSSAQINSILPSTTSNYDLANCIVPSSGNSVTFGTETNTTLSTSMGTLDTISDSIVISYPRNVTRTNTAQVYRPLIR